MSLRYFLSNFESVGLSGLDIFKTYFQDSDHLVHWSGTILANLVEIHLGNISVKFEGNWPRGVRGVVV